MCVTLLSRSTYLVPDSQRDTVAVFSVRWVDGRVGLTPEQTQFIPRGCEHDHAYSVKSSMYINTWQQLAYFCRKSMWVSGNGV